VDFRNRAIFPGFNDLPDENNVSLNFYASNHEFTYQPRQHLLFLAEIVDFRTLVRLQMDIKDIDGRMIPLFFYTDGRGSELAPAQVWKGYTAAILYAQRHTFMTSERGNPPQTQFMFLTTCPHQIFPLSLNSLLALSGRVQQFSTEMNGTRPCHGCGKRAASLMKCTRCSLFWYCNGACQSAGWSEKCHKADCKLLKDSDLNGLISLKGDNFEGHVGFPLNTARRICHGEAVG
ncbi:uncharacterized protein LY89DRAFT_591828, partial [Mollisia scopiformis]